MPVLQDSKHEAAHGTDDHFEMPRMDIYAPNRFSGPVGFIDFDRLRAKAENGKNVSERRCQIRTVKYK